MLVTDLPTDQVTGVCAIYAYASKKKPYSFNLNDKLVKTGEKYKIGGNIGKIKVKKINLCRMQIMS